jgi:alkyl hydroperoxide reductase subunit AhpC
VTIIDPKGIVRAFHVYPAGVLPVVDEVLRELAGLQGT